MAAANAALYQLIRTVFPPCNIDVLCDKKKTEIINVLVNGSGSGKEHITIMHICVLHSGIHYKMHTHIKFNTFQKVMFLAFFRQRFFKFHNFFINFVV